MKITKTRVRNIKPYTRFITEGNQLVIGLVNIEGFEEELKDIGFSEDLVVDEQVLPRSIGPRSDYNSEGVQIPQKDQEKEGYYQTREWTWKAWGRGPEQSKIVYIPRERYPREFLPPPSEEFRIAEKDGVKMLVSRKIVKNDDNAELITHLINLFLEIFGECDILTNELIPSLGPNVMNLNWKLLPAGEYPWERVEDRVNVLIQRQPEGNRPVIRHQIETITNHVPGFVAIGHGGFNHYMVFGFPAKGIYILESMKSGNATYVFNENWEAISTLTKKEILENDLQLTRIIHTDEWNDQINALLS